MIFYTSAWACVIIGGIILLHTACFLIRSHLSVILNIVNICLHISLVPVLLVKGAELSELVLIFMGSLALHTVFSYVRARRGALASGGDSDDV